MSIKIAILGSTGSIGTTTVNIIKKNIKDFKVIFLSTNNNVIKIYHQAIDLKVKNVIIINKKKYLRYKQKFIKKKIKVFHDHSEIKKIIKKKNDYTMCSISGLSGLKPTLEAIKYSKTVGIANKESIICSWNIIKKKLKKNKTNFIPIDSEHFSIWSLINNVNKASIEEIILTASGGPFLNKTTKSLKNINPKDAIKHPNWSMGKKISIDSANMMNKVFEVIEAHRLFKFDKSKYKIMIHPQSYVHSIIRFKNGLIKMILYNTDMKIPISNTLYKSKKNVLKTSNVEIKHINNLNFQKVNSKTFPSIKLLNKCFTLGLSTPIIINAANEVLVDLFLKGKIEFLDIVKMINRILRDQDFKKYAKRNASSVKGIKIIDNWARLKTISMCVI